MSNRLNQLGDGTRRSFCARFSHLADRQTPRGLDVDIVLFDVRTWPERRFVANKMVFARSKRWERLGRLRRGQQVVFEARVVNTEIGYDGDDFLLREENPRRWVWKLANPSKVSVITDNGRG